MDTSQPLVYVKEIIHETGVVNFALDDRSHRDLLPTADVAKPTNKGMMKAAIGSICVYDDGEIDNLKTDNTWGDFCE